MNEDKEDSNSNSTKKVPGSGYPFYRPTKDDMKNLQCNRYTARLGIGSDHLCTPDEDSPNDFNCCEDVDSEEHGCRSCSSAKGWGELMNGRGLMGESCCDNSVLAENTSLKCLGNNGEMNYDHCCKNTVRQHTSGPQDFFCFLEQGSPEGNWAFCLGLADYPPRMPGEERLFNLQPKLLRSQIAKNERNTDRIEIIVLVNLFICLILLVAWRKAIDVARLHTKLELARKEEEKEEDTVCRLQA